MNVGNLAAMWSRIWLDRKPRQQSRSSSLAELLDVEDILLNVAVSGKQQLFEAVGQHMQAVHAMPAEWVQSSLSRREQIGSTALGRGVAIPHARVNGLERILLAYLRLEPAIPFDAPDGNRVTDVLVILVPKRATEEHLEILADAAQAFSDERFREALHLCVDSVAVQRLLRVRSGRVP
jgi:PTS system nitrogen regulatory IIA component